jgi:tetratricopeptide (TPR) repeat protein
MEGSSYLCSFHIPKVGGTTFASHAQKSLGTDMFVLHGPFARVERFMRNQPQLEELPDEKRNAIRIVHGHGADLSLAETIVGRTPEFMIILRDPYARFVSGFHHYNREKRQNGLAAASEEKYFERRGVNYYAKTLRRNFAPLMLPIDNEFGIQALMPVLRSVKYFILTERLDSQLHEISVRYGLKTGKILPQRVNKEKSGLTIDAAAFKKRNAIDEELYSYLSGAAEQSGGSIENPFGYDPGPVKRHLESVWTQQTSNGKLLTAYDNLAAAASKTLKLQAVHLKLIHGSCDHVADKALLMGRISVALKDWIQNLDRQEAAAAHFWSGAMFAKERHFDAAEQYLRKAIELNPRNDNAMATLAKVLHAQGKRSEAKTFIERAISLRPDRPMTQNIRQLIMRHFNTLGSSSSRF